MFCTVHKFKEFRNEWCPILRDTFFFGMLCVAKQL